MMKTCIKCAAVIPVSRRAALPQTRTCVKCSDEAPVTGFMTWEHKTAPTFQVVSPRQHAWLQSRDRKGMRSGLPMSPRTESGIGTTVRRIDPAIHALSASNRTVVPRARCVHKDRPQVGPSGHCVECASKYYEHRQMFRSPV
jgi:hypothetical protein